MDTNNLEEISFFLGKAPTYVDAQAGPFLHRVFHAYFYQYQQLVAQQEELAASSDEITTSQRVERDLLIRQMTNLLVKIATHHCAVIFTLEPPDDVASMDITPLSWEELIEYMASVFTNIIEPNIRKLIISFFAFLINEWSEKTQGSLDPDSYPYDPLPLDFIQNFQQMILETVFPAIFASLTDGSIDINANAIYLNLTSEIGGMIHLTKENAPHMIEALVSDILGSSNSNVSLGWPQDILDLFVAMVIMEPNTFEGSSEAMKKWCREVLS
jgi:hypothetical protein